VNPIEIVLSGNMLLAMPLALLAGVISFLSPCVLPLVPGYLGFLGGLTTAADEGGTANRRQLVLAVALFVLGFTAIFIAYNAVFASLGFWLIRWQDLILRIAGVLVFVMGLVFIGKFGVMQRIIKPNLQPKASLAAAPLLGIVFGIGWTPCIGPVLAAISVLSLQTGSAASGVLLGVLFSLGIGIPFMVLAFGFGWAGDTVAWLRRHVRVINLVGGAVLMLIGVLMVSGVWSMLMSWFQAVMPGYVTPL
jgi:cytochrome c-type biogenesis protein